MVCCWPFGGSKNFGSPIFDDRLAGRPQRANGLSFFAPLVVLFLSIAVCGDARAERWMCPDCDAMVERVVGASLDCQACDGFYTEDDLSWFVAHVNYRTRDAEISFLVLPEDCGIFRADGLQALDADGAYWVPWTKVDFFIPRMRLIRLTDGRDIGTDYPKGPTCLKPPTFLFEITDDIELISVEPRVATKEVETDMAALFVVAGTAEALDRGVIRFIAEVEAGKHPRLPRTDARAARAQPVRIPRNIALADLENKRVVVSVRISDTREIQQVRIIESSGFTNLDNAAATRSLGAGLMGGGEMGVPVPATVEFHYTFAGGEPAVKFVVPGNSIWGDRGVGKEAEGK